MTPSQTRVVFMGSPAFAVPSLEALVAAGYSVVAAVTQPDRPAGRGGHLAAPEVKLAAQRLGIRVLQPSTLRDEATNAVLASLRPDVIVVAAYGKILPAATLAIPARGCVNVHASLLPRWRGASPIAAAILAGDPETGVTIMEMSREMDAGAIIAQARAPIREDDTTGTLEARLAALGAATLVDVLPGWLAGTRTATPQDESLVTYCQLLRKEDGHLRAAMTATEAERAVRAYNPWPGAFVRYRGERLGIWRAHVAVGPGAPPGALLAHERLPAIAFTGGLLVLDEVQRPGGKRVGGSAFLNGERGQLEPAVELA
jgi:methionyl-tRNA formyltransferase